MKTRKGVSARGWFYSRSFHSTPDAEADGAIVAALLDLAGADEAPTDAASPKGAARTEEDA